MPEPDEGIATGAAEPTEGHGTISRRGFGKASLGLVVAGGLTAGGVTAGAETAAAATTGDQPILGDFEPRSLSGANNNRAHPDWGAANTEYPRVTPAQYVDGLSAAPTGPNPRYVSNRIFNDNDVFVYSERNVSAWGFVWGQFLDHTFALRLGRRQTGEPGETANFAFDSSDPLETARNDLGVIFFERSIPAVGTGVTNARQQINQVSSYIDAAAVYGNDPVRLNWLREGPADGNPAHEGARLFLRPGDYLPRRNSRGNAAVAPNMVFGSLADPGQACVAGDQRANENPMLTATQTMFAREHNRLVGLLPTSLREEDKFQIARAVLIAEQQYITYTEFLPALGVHLPAYTGYRSDVNAGVSNEFATIGYRAHAMIRRDIVMRTDADRYSKEALAYITSLGVRVTTTGERLELTMPLGDSTFFKPDLIETLGIGPALQGAGLKPMRRIGEVIGNVLRSLVFPFSPNVQGINDLASVDIARGRDHGFPGYNDLRQAYGLPRRTSFRAITGEASESFPADPLLVPGNEINEPHSLDYVALYDIHGRPTTINADNATRGVRRTPLAARLKAIYGDVNKVDAFVGMMCEPHVDGREFGELQLAIWRTQFTAVRDGDRFFYEINPILPYVKRKYGIDYRTTLADVIARNTDIPRHELADNVFFAAETQDGEGFHGADAATAAAVTPLTSTGKPWHCGRAEI